MLAISMAGVAIAACSSGRAASSSAAAPARATGVRCDSVRGDYAASPDTPLDSPPVVISKRLLPSPIPPVLDGQVLVLTVQVNLDGRPDMSTFSIDRDTAEAPDWYRRLKSDFTKARFEPARLHRCTVRAPIAFTITLHDLLDARP
jgi:hypothetical protein